jgi:PAS domain S-box-containing protein
MTPLSSDETIKVDRTTDRYFQLLEALGQAVIVTDPGGEITLWSPAAKTLYGWDAVEVIGRNVLEVTPMEVSRAQGAEILETLARGELWSGQFEVRIRGGKAATASVTDIPLLDENGAVAGVVGVSALSRAPTKLRPLLRKLASACDRVWPGQVSVKVEVPAKASLPAAEPHMIQLLAVLVLLHADTLDRGNGIEIIAGAADESPFRDFGLAFVSPAVYVRIARRDQRATYSVLRSLPISAEPTKYASGLVRMVGGMLISGAAPEGSDAMHLFLPLEQPR